MNVKICSKCRASCVVVRNGSDVCNQCGFNEDALVIEYKPKVIEHLYSNMNIERASRIPGWMSDTELEWLANQAKEHHVIVELGSYKGRSTRALGDSTEGVVIAVDHWKGEAHLEMDDKERDMLFDEFVSNVKDLIELQKVIPVKVEHSNVGSNPILAEVKPDFVFIDGDHNQVKRDLNNWMKKIVPGGIIAGHDSTYEPIRKVITEMISNFKLVANTRIWYATVK